MQVAWTHTRASLAQTEADTPTSETSGAVTHTHVSRQLHGFARDNPECSQRPVARARVCPVRGSPVRGRQAGSDPRARPRAGEGAECRQPNDDSAAPGTQRKGALTRLKLQNTRRREGSRRGEQTAADVRWVAKAALGNPRDPRQPQISEALGGDRPEGSSTPWRRENCQP